MEDTRKKTYTIAKDYTVSNETFGLYLDSNTDMLVTFPKPNVNALSKYYESSNYISHTDSKASLFDKAYQIVKNIAVKNKTNLIVRLQPQKGSLLDIGAGTGDFLVASKSIGWSVVAVEPNQKAADLVLKKGLICLSDTSNLENNTFDVITMWHVLEHVPDLDVQITELQRLLKPKGTLIIAVPNYKSFDAKHYGRFWAAFDVPRHLYHFSKTSIKTIFESRGFLLQEVLPMWFDAFYVSMLSEKYQFGKINYAKAIFIGLKSNWKARKTRQYSSHIYVLKNK